MNLEEGKPNILKILPQPNDVTCGPTCLQAVYNYYGDSIDLKQVIKEVKQLKGGGTLGVLLGNHALTMGYQVEIYTYNLHMFDPTWFVNGADLIEKLEEQLIFKNTRKMEFASRAYQSFLRNGGTIKQEELSYDLISRHIGSQVPILTGLSATYLYQSAREIPEYNVYHDVKGVPAGHFVVLSGFEPETNRVLVADPLNPNPISDTVQYYKIDIQRVMNAILLGIVTYDANLLIIKPKKP
ncbi:MAG: C39 family peptidase [Cyclobacteriaceae bacterium]|nr:C39 family peptidase [Cyclobacteriaceae bacterium]